MNIKRINKDIWKIYGGIEESSNVYLLKDRATLIDLGNRANSDLLLKSLSLIDVKAEEIKIIIFTHLHYDHIGKPSLFKNAKFFASEQAITSYKIAPRNTTLQNWDELKNIKLNPLKEGIVGLKIIKTPGHTRGSICLYLKEQRILFSGDTLFENNMYGRTDLPTSTPKKLEQSLKELKKYDYKILCPGHWRVLF